MFFNDSLTKIVQIYFRAITDESFEFRGHYFKPKPLGISPSLLRTAYCPEQCGGCCPVFSLDYLPNEPKPHPHCKMRTIIFNRKEYNIWSILQDRGVSHFCHFLNISNGRCQIHDLNPFSCKFEPLRFKIFIEETHPNLLGCYNFGRGWAFKTVDGRRGAKCVLMDSPTSATRAEVLDKLNRLKSWADYFDLKTKVPRIIRLVERFELKDKIIILD